MDRTIGNYTSQSNKDFPLDCETLEALQTNTAMVAIIGNLAGDKVILSGCAEDTTGSRRGAGYVFLRTKAYPEGEVLRWEGGATTSGMYVKLSDVAITAQGNSYPKAYTVRSLAPGIGSENYRWEDFAEVKNLRELMAEAARLETEIKALAAPPLGIVELWAGSTVPAGYGLCNGQQLKASEYPELYKAIGSTFNTAMNANGTKYTTTSGYFRLPDLRGRFVVGQSDIDSDYSGKGNGGGEKKHTLTADEMPKHRHRIALGQAKWGDNANVRNFPKYGGNDGDGDYQNSSEWKGKNYTDETGSGAAHENRPPYYVLAYIMRLK